MIHLTRPFHACVTLFVAACAVVACAQNETPYRQPPDPIPRILDAPAPAALLVSPDQRRAVETRRRSLPTVSELAVEAVETAGLRINPATNGRVDQPLLAGLALVDLESLERQSLGLPADLRAHDLRWSPDGRRLAWCRSADQGIELWLTEVAGGVSARVGDLRLNAAVGSPLAWLPDGAGLVCLRVPPGRGAPPRAGPPQGPVVLENHGKVAAARTTPFLIESDHDELLFEHYAAAELVEISLDGAARPLLPPGVIISFNISPDGRYVLVERVHRPLSRSLALWDFPQEILVVDRQDGVCHQVADLPLADQVSIKFGSVRPGPRDVHWRADLPATLCWAEALDGGDASRPATERDLLLEQPAPFDSPPRELARLQDRFSGLVWGRADLALLWESWHKDRRERIWRLNPSTGERFRLLERDSDDAWSEPGRPQTARNALGRSVLRCSPDGEWIYWAGRGVDSTGVHPYLDRMRVADGSRERLWSCRDPWYESLLEMLDDRGERLLLRRESREEPENVWLLDRPKGKGVRARGTADFRARPVTRNEDPAPMLAGLQQEVLHYRRADGVELSATLYLPPSYRRGVDPPLPAILWAYPREFKTREAAGRATSSEFTFSRPGGTSPLFLLTQGYAVVDDPSLPILGEDGAEPNDRYLDELTAGARAVVRCLGGLGVVDTTRLAIGGHSYGAFTAANLLAHTDLFRTAICCSGAYNRTLTPFGFQGEDRSLWQAPEAYLAMSPFLAADRITRPILLIHGMEDPNSGTFPLQSDRFYDALKGLGATARLVRLPAEGHGYRSRESVGHVLWEMATWCDDQLKPAPGGLELNLK